MSVATGRKGTPRKFQHIDQVQTLIDEYFTRCTTEKRPYTVTGLARALGFTRQGLIEYEQREDDYDDAQAIGDAIKEAKMRVGEFVEEGLWREKGHPAGPIFILKNNYGWRDEQQIAVSHSVVFGTKAQLEPPTMTIQALSPAPETAIALSPALGILVSDDQS